MTRYRLIPGSAIGAALCNPIRAGQCARRPVAARTRAGDRAAARLYGDAPRPAPQPSVETVSTISACRRVKLSSNSRCWSANGTHRRSNCPPSSPLPPRGWCRPLSPKASAAIAQGPGTTLNETASEIFVWLVEDLRDGRTPMDARYCSWSIPIPTCCPRMCCSKRRSQAATSRARWRGSTRSAWITRGLGRAGAHHRPGEAQAHPRQYGPLALARTRSGQAVPADQCARIPAASTSTTDHQELPRRGGCRPHCDPQLAEMVEAVIFNPTWCAVDRGEGLRKVLTVLAGRGPRLQGDQGSQWLVNSLVPGPAPARRDEARHA